MHIIILSPNANTLLTAPLLRKLKNAGRVTVVTKPKPFAAVAELKNKEPKILALDPDFSNWTVPDKTFQSIPGLKAICLQTTSFSWVNVAEAKKLNIPVINIKGFSTEAVAEWALLMALNVTRKIPLVIKSGWKKEYLRFQGTELKGKIAGVIGMGAIGTRIAELCQASGMRVQYWSKHSRDDRFFFTPLPTLIKTSDYVFPAVAQNDDTKAILTDKLLSMLKPGAIFVSIVHEIYNHQLLLKMVKNDNLYGYAFEDAREGNFDTYEGNVWAGPELGWVTDGSLKRNAEGWVENIVNAAGGNYSQRIN